MKQNAEYNKFGIRVHTPTEKYDVGGRAVYVKREDMQGDNKFLPAWGKLLATKHIVDNLPDDRPLVALNTYGSWSGWAFSHFCKSRGIEFHMVYPKTNLIHKDYLDIVANNGAVLKDIRPNMFKVLYGQMGKYAKENNFQLVPYAYNTKSYLQFAADRMYDYLNKTRNFDNLVVSSGSGVTLSGLASGFLKANPEGRIWTCTVGTSGGIEKQIARCKYDGSRINVEDAKNEFKDLMPNYETPFPCNQHWDKKTWHWLENNINRLEGSILFWNLGGYNTFCPPFIDGRCR